MRIMYELLNFLLFVLENATADKQSKAISRLLKARKAKKGIREDH